MAPVLSIEDLTVSFSQPDRSIFAVRQVSLAVAARECVAIVGESGSGKTQIFMAAMGLLAGNATARGSVRFEGGEILGAQPPQLKIGTQLAEVLVCHAGKSWNEARIAARRMLERVRVPDPAHRLTQYPHELSGGLRQRVTIGMSLLCEPLLVIADEPTTALDVTVQAQIIDLLRAMREEVGMALVLISHDLGVVAGLADRILVMYAGRIVESADSAELFRDPRHPYTAALLKCIPSLSGPRLERLPTLPGQPPQPSDLLDGCAFAPRCPRAAERCRVERPLLRDAGDAIDGGPDGTDNGGNAIENRSSAIENGGARRVACHFPLSP